MNYPTINPAFQNLIPPPTEEELKLLDKNIRKDGVRDSLVTWNGQLIDGHNRLSIIKKRKLPFRIHEMDFENEGQAQEWIILNQFGRRNLDNWQRAKLAMKLQSLFAAKALENKAEGGSLPKDSSGKRIIAPNGGKIQPIHTSKELAKISGLGPRTIERVQKILSNATPSTRERLDKGEISISKAYENTIKKQKQFQKKLRTKKGDDTPQEFLSEGKTCSENMLNSFNDLRKQCKKNHPITSGSGYNQKDLDELKSSFEFISDWANTVINNFTIKSRN